MGCEMNCVLSMSVSQQMIFVVVINLRLIPAWHLVGLRSANAAADSISSISTAARLFSRASGQCEVWP